MDESNKNWLNQQAPHVEVSQSQPPAFNAQPEFIQSTPITSTTFNSQPEFIQSTPIMSTTSANFNGFQNWPLPPQLYSQYSQWFNQPQMNANLSPSFAQTPMPPRPNFGNLQAMQNMSQFFPYSFHNPLQQSPQPFLPSTPMTGSPMTGSPMTTASSALSSPILTPANMSAQSISGHNMILERKRPRITYNQNQVAYLEHWYNSKNRFISTAERNEIAAALNVSPSQIRIWFQNRRARERQRSTNRSQDSSNSTTPSSSNATLNNDSTYSSLNDSGIGMNTSELQNMSALQNMPPNNLQFTIPSQTAFGQQQQMPMTSSMFNMLRYNQPQQPSAVASTNNAPADPELKQQYESEDGQK